MRNVGDSKVNIAKSLLRVNTVTIGLSNATPLLLLWSTLRNTLSRSSRAHLQRIGQTSDAALLRWSGYVQLPYCALLFSEQYAGLSSSSSTGAACGSRIPANFASLDDNPIFVASRKSRTLDGIALPWPSERR